MKKWFCAVLISGLSLVACRPSGPTPQPLVITIPPPPTDTIPTPAEQAEQVEPSLTVEAVGPALEDLSSGWNRIEPGGDTACAHGTPYAFWVRRGRVNKLLVYLQGGGGCWDADTCRATNVEFNGFYDSAVTEGDNPARRYGGILNLDDPENPFRDYHIVYAPVCTGDVHWGDNVHTYTDDSGEVTINFKGFVNTGAALNWAYANIPNPESVFVTGCSAGSVGSIVHAPYIIEHYPGVPVVQFGDSLSFIFGRPVDLQTDWHVHDNFPQWIPELVEMAPLDWTMAKYYTAIARYYPDYVFSQFNTARDEVQVFYTFPDGGGDGSDWEPLLEEHLLAIHSAVPNYRSFTAGGDLHCVLPRGEFYTYAIDGVRLVDWVRDLANGEPVPSLHCTDCSVPEFNNGN